MMDFYSLAPCFSPFTTIHAKAPGYITLREYSLHSFLSVFVKITIKIAMCIFIHFFLLYLYFNLRINFYFLHTFYISNKFNILSFSRNKQLSFIIFFCRSSNESSTFSSIWTFTKSFIFFLSNLFFYFTLEIFNNCYSSYLKNFNSLRTDVCNKILFKCEDNKKQILFKKERREYYIRWRKTHALFWISIWFKCDLSPCLSVLLFVHFVNSSQAGRRLNHRICKDRENELYDCRIVMVYLHSWYKFIQYL